MNKKELKKFKEGRLNSIIKLFSFNDSLTTALDGLSRTNLLSAEEKKIVEPMLPKLFSIDKELREFLLSYNLNPLDFLSELNGIEYDIVKKEG